LRRRLDEQVIVIVHQAIGVTQPSEARHDFAQAAEKPLPVLVVEKDRTARIAARGHVMDRTGEFEPEGTGHRRKLCRQKRDVKT